MIILTWKWTKNLAIKFQFIWLNHPRPGPKPPSSRQGLARRLFFCAAFTSYYEENDRGQTITAKKTDLLDEMVMDEIDEMVMEWSAVSEHDGRVFCWLCQLDIISHVNLTFSFTN